jgi:benzoyl-CoA reductase/2-hydroxyglutaryl-CoA dehydratase subunit BcrC/BadD/HgdB
MPASRAFLMNLPATWQTPTARRLYLSELERLGRFLVSMGGTCPGEQQLDCIMRRFDERRSALRAELADLDARAAAQALADYFSGFEEPSPGLPATLSHRMRKGSREASGVRIGIIGGPLLPDQFPLLDAIEAAGGRMVLNATEPGERCLIPLFPRTSGVPALERLANHYFDHALDVFHRPDTRLARWLGDQIRGRCICGIVVWCQVGCDLWRAQATAFRDQFQVPTLMLDAADRHAISPREVNRVGAFVESLR